ncbi:MAG: PIN domain containing protein VapC [Candidatus Methanohalarchaeum thermophilum]|uniref:PIN domain containing protein VapC n=1 Tax=Methanohalarchaeum thermophilum TaxID=1903181 RepID=A0A1Q6DTX3_METT1|nr:MAG: PIN domain containing protein VapC [Candidatus Methanohalarchaeum thermophilum]
MNTHKCFFDTLILTLDFMEEKEIEVYSSENDEIVPCYSLYVKEEFLHKLATREVKNVISEESVLKNNFKEIWDKFESHLSFFKFLDPNPKKVDLKTSDIINKFIYGSKDFYKDYNTNFPGGKDIIHIATAELKNCEKIITTDRDFKKLKDFNLGFSSLNEVVIINQKTLEIKESQKI